MMKWCRPKKKERKSAIPFHKEYQNNEMKIILINQKYKKKLNFPIRAIMV